MQKFLFAVSTSFGRAFLATALVVGIGILSAPDLEAARALSLAGLLAAIAAGFRAVQVLVPGFSFGTLIPQPYGAWLDSFARAFLAAFLVGITGVLAAPDFEVSKALLVAAIVGALAAGLRAIQGITTKGELPAPEFGT